ncbi:hypothetical protein C7N43_23130 [Sphingobacteriales bacterium UPWRP_1]|nr:hypothetical protein BVG80_16460 [Sphingobacteriales bacterium TSM_CSM]PSJ74592.1 hypothetical protein C7N43_23130 [Sphingobacteriales bacterium UPWRP_1]
MKKAIFLQVLTFCLVAAGAQAQSLTPQVVASGGGYAQGGGYSLSYTIGEPVTATLTSGSNILTQGFHQPDFQNIVKLLAKVYLEGAFNGANMNTTLSTLPAFPLTQPYNTAPWNYNGAEGVATLPANVVDWLYVELRDATFAPVAGGKRAVFLLSDGTLRDVDGTPGASFLGAVPGNYYVIVRHRNHLAVMSASQVGLPNASVYDFTTAAAQAFGVNQQKALTGGVFGLYAADFDANGVITVADFNFYANTGSQTNVYNDADANLDKQITVSDFNLYQPNASVIGIQQVRY